MLLPTSPAGWGGLLIRSLRLGPGMASLARDRSMLVACSARGASRARSQPVAHVLDLLLGEGFIVKRTCQGRDTLAAGEKMHRQGVGIGFVAEQRELSAQPGPK